MPGFTANAFDEVTDLALNPYLHPEVIEEYNNRPNYLMGDGWSIIPQPSDDRGRGSAFDLDDSAPYPNIKQNNIFDPPLNIEPPEPVMFQPPNDLQIKKWGLEKFKDKVKQYYRYAGNNQWAELRHRPIQLPNGKYEAKNFKSEINEFKKEVNVLAIINQDAVKEYLSKNTRKLTEETMEEMLKTPFEVKRNKIDLLSENIKDKFSDYVTFMMSTHKQIVNRICSLPKNVKDSVLGFPKLAQNYMTTKSYITNNPKATLDQATAIAQETFTKQTMQKVATLCKDKFKDFIDASPNEQGKIMGDIAFEVFSACLIEKAPKLFTSFPKILRIKPKPFKLPYTPIEQHLITPIRSDMSLVALEELQKLQSFEMRMLETIKPKCRRDKAAIKRILGPTQAEIKEFFEKAKLLEQLQEYHFIRPNQSKKIAAKSKVIIPESEFYELSKQLIGKGKTVTSAPGQSGFKEIIDYGKIIGYDAIEATEEKISTRFGKVHYRKNGFYHIVPYAPKDEAKFLKWLND